MMNWSMAKEAGLLRYVFRRLAWRALSRTKRSRIPYRLPGGQRIMLPPRSPFAADIYCTRGRVDWGSEQLLLEWLSQSPPDGCCYDIGANMGYYSVLLASVTGRVFAFEPDPRNHADLLAQDNRRITLVSKAVSDRHGKARFDVSSASTVGHLSDGGAGRGQIEVEVVSLDAFRDSRPAAENVSAVKMDVEGFEMSCLRGAVRMASRDRPVFLIEFAIEEGRPNSLSALGAFVEAQRYGIYAMIRRRRGRSAFRTVLEPTTSRALASLDFKMLFLVPEEDTFFAGRADEGFCFEGMPSRS